MCSLHHTRKISLTNNKLLIQLRNCISQCDSEKLIFKEGIFGFPSDSNGKESACSAGDLGSVPGLGRSPGEGNGNPLQYSCLENAMDRGTWWATVHGVTKSWTRLSD